jgi:hypothetical protein
MEVLKGQIKLLPEVRPCFGKEVLFKEMEVGIVATYVSQATYNAGTAAQKATWTVDPGITSAPGTPQITVPAAQVAAASYSPPSQPSSTLTESQKQQILFQQGLAYGNPNAPEYQALYQNAQQPQVQVTTPSVTLQAASTPRFTYIGETMPIVTQTYQPSPLKPNITFAEVQVPSPFGFSSGVLGVTGLGTPTTVSQMAIIGPSVSSNPFGLTNQIGGVQQPASISNSVIMAGYEATSIPTSLISAKNWYVQDQLDKQQVEIQNVVQSYAAKGVSITPYQMQDIYGTTYTLFGNEKREFSILPATPSERTRTLITPFQQAVARANTGDIFGTFFPSLNLLPQKISYKSPSLRIATDLALSFPGMVGWEATKLTAGSYYRLAPIEFQTKEQLDIFKVTPSKQAAYKQLSEEGLKFGQKESAVNIGVTGAFIIGGEIISAGQLTATSEGFCRVM